MKQTNPNPFLFTRIEQQIQMEAEQQPLPAFARILSPVIVSVLLIATVFVGILFFGPGSHNSTTFSNNASVIAGQYQMNLSQQDILLTYYLTEE